MKRSHEAQGFRRTIFLIAALSYAAYAIRAPSRESSATTEPDAAPAEEPVPRMTASILTWGERPKEPSARRAAIAFTVTTLFFSGIAVTAGADDDPARVLEDTTEVVTTETGETTTGESAEPAPPPPAPPAPISEPDPVSDPAAEPPPLETSAGSSRGSEPESSTPADASAVPAKRSAVWTTRLAPKRAKRHARPGATAKQEAAAHGGAAVIWLSRALPDPTPRARRLDRWFVYDLVRSSRRADVDWALVLGVVRARGHGGREPVDELQLAAVAERLRDAGAARDERAAAAAVMGSADRGDEAVALARYNRAVGTETLVRGLSARKDALVERLLKDRRAEIYASGRDDLGAGRIDVRVVALISYLAESFGGVTVTSLFSGHRLYARPGVVSAHVYGHAVDIAALGGVPITGHQEPGGLTEEAVRSILLLPAELQPEQVISLLGLGGASFPLADHHDHIHVGY